MNTQVLLIERPTEYAEAKHFEIKKTPIPTPGEEEMLLRTVYISLDPAMRGWMNDAKSYIPPVKLGDVMRAGTISQVVESNVAGFEKGDYVVGNAGVQEYALSKAKGLFKIPPGPIPLPTYLSTLGMPGLTGYFGFLDVGAPKEGDRVLVSGGAGAVGSVVGQIAKIKGCEVVGIAGGPEKCAYMKDELGFDGVIDYKSENIYSALKKNMPKGIDIYFDNVGGPTLDAALAFLRYKGRVVLCGAISQYNSRSVKGPSNYLSLLVNRGRMEGLIVFDYADRYMEGILQMGQWMMEGKLKSREHIEQGIERFPEVLLQLFNGKKKGKLILQAGEE